MRLTGQRLAIVRALANEGGEIVDEQGFATRALHEATGERQSMDTLKTTLKALEDEHVIERRVRGRRVFSIKLTDEGKEVLSEVDPTAYEKMIVALDKQDEANEVAFDSLMAEFKPSDFLAMQTRTLDAFCHAVHSSLSLVVQAMLNGAHWPKPENLENLSLLVSNLSTQLETLSHEYAHEVRAHISKPETLEHALSSIKTTKRELLVAQEAS